jgi:cephalosporin hydroxylase
MEPDYEFTTDWFTTWSGVWTQILDRIKPRTYLEVGVWEGRATCFVIDRCAGAGPMEVHCVDTWAGGVEHDPAGMADVERRFDANVARAAGRAAHPVQVHKHKAPSAEALVRLLAEGRAERFDLIYLDGSHQAPDVLTDAVLAFRLLKVGGVLIFDDYLWSMEEPGRQDFYNMPKPAIDAFLNIFQRKVDVLSTPLYQIYTRKRSS